MAEDSSSGREPIAGLSNNDIKPYVYEGGFKTWECSVDLANYLAEMIAAEEETTLTSGLDIVEVSASSRTIGIGKVVDICCSLELDRLCPASYCSIISCHDILRDLNVVHQST